MASADRILEIADGEVRPIVERPRFSTASVPWAGFLIEECVTTMRDSRQRTVEKSTVYVCNRGEGTATWMHRGSSHGYHIVTGSVCITHTSYEMDSVRISNPWRYLALALDTSKFRHYAPREAKAIETSLVPMLFVEDAPIASLLTAMHGEAKAGCPSGRLYAESLSLALLSYLTGSYTDRRFDGDRSARLSPDQKRRIVQLIRDNLDTEITVSDLAASIGVSAAHFSRLFKATFGVSPHRFITWERIARAKTLLADPRWTVTYIAAELGFSSHSHFTKVFHSLVGVTPTQFRDGR